MSLSRFDVNAAIQRLLGSEDFDVEAAKTIVEFGHSLKLVGNYSFGVGVLLSDQESENAAGDCANEDSTSISGPRIELGASDSKERIGNYRIFKLRSGTIVFYSYWAASSDAHLEPPDLVRYYLEYDASSLAPLSLDMTSSVVRTYSVPFIIRIVRTKRIRQTIKGEGTGRITDSGGFTDISIFP
ncbi:hypothetical protein HGA64_04385 [Candidatus Falkowbacteria bacterium]|nr:hypothetical protein [Candidatus Falkowbacteria bacterium]